MAPPHLQIGRSRSDESPVDLQAPSTLRHVMAVGSSGSGKTVFCKVLTEEMLLQGVPVICVDPQGDLCSLALAARDPEALRDRGVDPDRARRLHETADVVLFTPASRKGIPLSVDPVQGDPSRLPPKERVYAVSGIASMIVALLGYDLDGDDGEGLAAVFDQGLSSLLDDGRFPRDLEELTRWFLNLGTADLERFEKLVNRRKIEQAGQRLARLDVGARRLLFHEGLPLSIDLLLGRGEDAAAIPGKTRVSVIYLNTLQTQEDKDFFVAALVDRLYQWMLAHPSREPQALFYIDEVAPFIPPVRKPCSKPGLNLLFKQARKYGVSCLMATQNPGDVDYKAMAQFGTWSIGRLTTRQDIAKVQPTLKALDPSGVDAITSELPSQRAGQFFLISPDNFRETRPLQTRWLYTEHRTLDEDTIERLTRETTRHRFTELERRLTSSNGTPRNTAPSPPSPPEPPASPEPPAEPGPARESAPPDPELEEHLARLDQRASWTSSEFADDLQCSPHQARRILRGLEATGHARMFRDGRHHRYWSVRSGYRPDLSLTGPVLAVVPRLRNRSDVLALGEDLKARRFLGLFGNDEELADARLEYRFALRLHFRERVRRSFWRRLFGKRHDDLLAHVYLHPVSLRLVAFDAESGIRFEIDPPEYGSAVRDFDGAAAFEKILPGTVRLHEADWTGRRDDAEVRKAFESRFKAQLRSVEPVLIPSWQLRMRRSGQGDVRLVTIDAVTGREFEW